MNSRNKGHRFERQISNDLKELGFTECKTSRAVSKLLDDCGIDIAVSGMLIESIPFLIQCKAGYDKKRPKPELIFKYIEDKLKLNFPEGHRIHSVPKVLIHKLDNGKGTYMTMDYDSNKHLLQNIVENVQKNEVRDTERGVSKEQNFKVSSAPT